MNLASEPAAFARDPFDPMYYARVLMRRRWVVLGVLAAIVALVGVYTLRQPRLYEARTSVIIDANPPRVLDKAVEEVVDQGTGSYWYNKEYYQTQYKVVVSRAVAQRVVDKLGLQNDESFLGLDKLSPEKRAEALSRRDAAEVLQRKIKVEPAKDSRLLYIVIIDLDPKRAALLANEVAEAFIQETLSLKLRLTESASQWLEDRLNNLAQTSKQSELELYDFKKTEDMLTTSLEDRQSMVSQRLTATNAALTEVRLKIAGLKAAVDAIRGLKQSAASEKRWADALPAAANNHVIQQLKIRHAEQRAACDELAERYLKEHPKLKECQEKLASAEANLLRELTTLVRAAETELAEATVKEKNLGALLEQAKADAFQVNKKQIEFDRLKRESDNNQRLYDLVLKRLKDIELSGLLRTSNVRVLDAARPELIPVKPNVKVNMALALVLGLLGGLGLALLLEFLDDSITSQAEIEERLETPFLGFVPNIPDHKVPNLADRDLHIHKHPKSSVAECCRAIRTNLLFMTPDKPCKTVLVTSSGPQEGKSTSVISLGIAMAQSGNRVLLIDTDMRRPRLHKAFGVPSDIGVSSLILDDSRLAQAIKTTDVPGLFVLPCGPIPPNPAELLHTQAFAELLKKLIDRFDKVLLDSPPVGAVADAVVLGTQVDGVLIVLRAGRTSREMARRAVKALRDVKARIFGTVLNNINLSDRKYDYYYYYAKQYGTYYGEQKEPHPP